MVLHDDLVSAEIVALASRQAMVHNVGKRCGTKKITQPDINVLMVEIGAAWIAGTAAEKWRPDDFRATE